MKTAVLLVVVIVLLALDWAALHDILKGEPNVVLEYGLLGFSLVVIGSLVYYGLRNRRRA